MNAPKFFLGGIAMLISMVSCSKSNLAMLTQGGKTTGAAQATITDTIQLGGNGYVSKPASGGAEVITDYGLGNWTSSSAVTSTYFRVNTAGKLNVSMNVKTSTGSSKVKVTVNGTAFTLNLAASSSYAVVSVGSVTISQPGYVKIDVQGVSKTGGYFGDVASFLVSGASITGAENYVTNQPDFYFGRRGPSVHMSYTQPAGNTEWFYNEVTVPVGYDPVGSYFESNGFNEGYFGMQVNSTTERRILFSVWNPDSGGNVTALRSGTGVTVTTFTGEGNGGQSYLDYNWKAGNTYKFLTHVKPDGSGNTVYTSYFYAPEVGSWKLIASFSRPNTTTYYKGAYSFVENFAPDSGYITRKAKFNNEWAYSDAGVWKELTTGYYDGDAIGNAGERKDYGGGLDSGSFYLQNGGFFSNFVTLNTYFTRPAKGVTPTINFNTLP